MKSCVIIKIYQILMKQFALILPVCYIYSTSLDNQEFDLSIHELSCNFCENDTILSAT